MNALEAPVNPLCLACKQEERVEDYIGGYFSASPEVLAITSDHLSSAGIYSHGST